jgi:dihydrofolate reductase
MRKLIYFMHASLDGFAAGPNGEMNWITINEEMFDFVGTLTDKADAGLYGRVTFEMMEGYWPTAANQPNASKHDREHAAWYENAYKIVLSRTIDGEGLLKTKVISENLVENINAVKNLEGKDILIFGSPRASYSLLAEGLVDEFWLFVNPIILGVGMPVFKDVPSSIQLKLIETKTFACGVIATHYGKKSD